MNHDELWQKTIANLTPETNSANFKLFFKNTFILNHTDNQETATIAIATPHQYAKENLESRYQTDIEGELSKRLDKLVSVEFEVAAAPPDTTSDSPSDTPLFSQETEDRVEHQRQTLQLQTIIKKAKLRKEYTFENFAVSPTNEVAYAGATAVAKNPGTAYNPLFLYGDVGVGKTHLMHAVGIRILQNKVDTRMVYCMGEQFTNEIIEAIQNKRTPDFRNRYRPAEVLLIDDIQFIAGKNTVQEEFFHTFNAIQSAGGQVILTSDRPPHEIKLLEDRLRSRFEEGLTIDIQQPNFELRTAILLIKAKQLSKHLPMEIAQMIANHITSTRKLQGFLTNLFTQADLNKQSVTPDFTLDLLKKQHGESAPPPLIQKSYIRPKDVVRAVSKYYKISEQQLFGKRRSRPIVVPRQIAMYLLRTDLNMSYPEIGRIFGGRDHTTAMHSVQKIEEEASLSQQMQMEFSTIRKLVYG